MRKVVRRHSSCCISAPLSCGYFLRTHRGGSGWAGGKSSAVSPDLGILIRTAICREGKAWFHVGAGIVADSDPEAEYEETLNKAAGWLAALNLPASALALYPASGSPNLRA